MSPVPLTSWTACPAAQPSIALWILSWSGRESSAALSTLSSEPFLGVSVAWICLQTGGLDGSLTLPQEVTTAASLAARVGKVTVSEIPTEVAIQIKCRNVQAPYFCPAAMKDCMLMKAFLPIF
ncbi:hypothetical protein ALO65_200341 [Pseudomonas syringae pv. papulans]|nr:hypothetical protein ALO65_200341 [Pseudomonas syringae pv. papulans]RMN73912.1 hypothetical protein ALQ56_200209 [Pseudomonas syringae pv. papulans]